MSGPTLSIILPAYHSARTLARALADFCAQTYPAREIIVVDSTPRQPGEADPAAALCAGRPGVRYHHSPTQLLPHAARNLGVTLAQGELLLFTDPDIYAPPRWAAQMVTAFQTFGGMIAGAVRCYGREPAHLAHHFGKFDLWLPGGATRRVDSAASANLLCHARDLARVGGFDPTDLLGDTTLGWDFRAAGLPITFVPSAWVEHHHLGGYADLWRERRSRGEMYGRLRARYGRWRRPRAALQLASTPVRLPKLVARTVWAARLAGLLAELTPVLPAVALAHAAWLAGEDAAYLRQLAG